MKKYKILVFPAGTEIAFEIFNALKYSKFVELYGGTSVPCHAEYLFKNCIEGFPFVKEDNFISFLNEVIEKYDIDYIYPAHDDACLKLTQMQDEIKAKVVTSPFKTVDICRSKNKTYEYLKEENYIPKFFSSIDEIKEYPIFIKPTVGQGSEGARKIETKEELERALKEDTVYTMCEYLPGNEYTIDCFTDKNGKLRVVHARQRERIRAGISVRSSLIDTDEQILKIAENINSHFEFNGAWFFQLKKNCSDEYRLMEISPRIPGTMCVSRNLGINFPLLTLYNMWGFDVDIIDNGNKVTLDRAFINRFKTDIEYDTVYLDFDDTLYLDEDINISLVSFLYQCVNQNKKIILLTKHAKDLDESLNKFKISKLLFDEIIHINKEEDKSKYITEKKAIFIDDSFAERKNIKEKCDIPVFDLDMIESLLDWRI